MDINPYIITPVEVDWEYAVKLFNDETRNLETPTGRKLCHNSPNCSSCTEGQSCFHCILDMTYHDSGKDIYPETKRSAFASAAVEHGYAISRSGYEGGGNYADEVEII